MNRIAILLFCTLVLGAANLSAQESTFGNAFEEGKMSLSFGLPGGGNPYASGTAAIWYGMSDQMNLGFNVGLGIDTASKPDSTLNLLLAPTLKYYLMPGSEVTPFMLGQLNLGLTTLGDDAVDLGILGGFGVEYFLNHVFSIAVHTGIGIDLLRPNDVDPLKLGTITSGLSGQIYW